MPACLLVSVRGPADALYRDELARLEPQDGLAVHWTFTRDAPPDWDGWTRRLTARRIAAVAPPPKARPLVFICGPAGFVEAAADHLVDLGHDPRRVRTERFGPS